MDLSARPDWSEHYFRKLFRSYYPAESMQDHLYIAEGINLWELNQHNLIWQDGKNHFSYGNGISLCENQIGYKELYSFYAKSDHTEMNAFYLRNISFLKKFKAYFVEKAAPLITQAERNKFILPLRYRTTKPSINDATLDTILTQLDMQKTPKASLSKRERDCLEFLAKGWSASEIADSLQLSKRTIQNYIANMKSKWHCSKTSELIYTASKTNILN